MRGYRVGVVRPSGPFGRRVRSLLSEGELPVVELKLFQSGIEEGATLTQFGDDVVVTQPLDPDLFPHLDVLFVSGDESDVLNRTAREAAEQGVLTLVEGASGLDGPVVTPARAELLRSGRERLGNVPRMSSYVVGETLRVLAEAHEVTRAVATVLLPAQVMGDPGVEELHQQVVHILNFKDPPKDVFQDQLAFNAKLAPSAGDPGAMAESVAREASALAGIENALTVNLVHVPVFHGYCASIWVELSKPLEAKEVAAQYRSTTFELAKTSRTAKLPSPVAVAGSAKIHLGPIRKGRSSGPAGFWLWTVADTTAYDPGSAAVEIARAVLA